MTKYIVNIYRAMRLSYADIEADTPQAAAAIAGGKPTADADNIEDCDGQNLAALVDVAGDEDHSQSVSVDFEPERQRKAARKMLAALLLAQGALNTAPRFRVSDTDSYQIASFIDDAVAEANEGQLHSSPRPYSVLLLYPDYLDDSGYETFYAFVQATDPIEAWK